MESTHVPGRKAVCARQRGGADAGGAEAGGAEDGGAEDGGAEERMSPFATCVPPVHSVATGKVFETLHLGIGRP